MNADHRMNDEAMTPQPRSNAVRALREPLLAVKVLRAIGRGWYYRIKFRLLGRRVIVGRNFRVTGRLDIRGPGTVIFGDDCAVYSGVMQVTTPWTHTPEAVIRFGNRVMLSGTRLGCTELIEVADDAGLSDGRIMDNDFHRIDARSARERANSPGRSKPVRIGRNAWLGTDAMILKGVTLGDNAVVGARAVVANNVPANAIVFGNPARVVWRIRPPQPAVAAASVRPAAAAENTAADATPAAVGS